MARKQDGYDTKTYTSTEDMDVGYGDRDSETNESEENEIDSGIHESAVKGNKLVTDPHSYNKGMIHPSFPNPKEGR